ncbi:single-stranded-DNA-specific exonuclease RecJ [Candidatus Parcubacteria bacterium]|nr:single-stranded-DNA-specific exonuclease RecJ [Candidatus Parcubacteria bacterium]
MQEYPIADVLPKSAEDELAGYDLLTRKLLWNRGIGSRAAAEKFLAPDWERDSHDPFLIKGMGRAVERILEAIESGEKIIIYGDYDCDGIPGSVILHDFFRKINYGHFANYIPHRHKEGYGLNMKAIDAFAKDGVSLIVTVDLAITDVAEVAHAEALGINVIVTDHHLPQAVLPPAYAVLNSKQAGDEYPDRMLSGAGVAFKLVQALLKKRGIEWGVPAGFEKWLLDMAGLAAIADLVPLVNENRLIAYYGLKVLRKSPRVGLRKLLSKMRVDQEHLTEEDVAFMIAPRVNAASRMDIPHEAFRLLSTRDEDTAEVLANHLHDLNDTRKGLVAGMVREAKTRLEERVREMEVIVIGNPEWRPGVLGLLASRLVEEHGKPAFVWGKGEEADLKGSCRSDGTVNMVELMTSVTDGTFIDVGGHELAGGFSVSHEKIHLIEEELTAAYRKVKKGKVSLAKAIIDCALTLDEVNETTYVKLEKLAPFGIGNPKPTFLFENAVIEEVKHFGKEKNHLELVFHTTFGDKISAIGFFKSAESFKKEISAGTAVNLIATFEKSYFKRRPQIRLRIVDIV